MLTAKLGKGKNGFRYFEFLIDSGSDYTITPKLDASILGIDYSKLKAREIAVEAANLTMMHGKEVKLKMQMGELVFDVPVLVTKEEVDRLLDRKGVFEKFEITFRERAGLVIFEEI